MAQVDVSVLAQPLLRVREHRPGNILHGRHRVSKAAQRQGANTIIAFHLRGRSQTAHPIRWASQTTQFKPYRINPLYNFIPVFINIYIRTNFYLFGFIYLKFSIYSAYDFYSNIPGFLAIYLFREKFKSNNIELNLYFKFVLFMFIKNLWNY